MTSLFLVWSSLLVVAQINAATTREEIAYQETTYALERGLTWSLLDMRQGHVLPASDGSRKGLVLEDNETWFVEVRNRVTRATDPMASHYIVLATNRKLGTMCMGRIFYEVDAATGCLQPIRIAVNY